LFRDKNLLSLSIAEIFIQQSVQSVNQKELKLQTCTTLQIYDDKKFFIHKFDSHLISSKYRYEIIGILGKYWKYSYIFFSLMAAQYRCGLIAYYISLSHLTEHKGTRNLSLDFLTVV